LTQTLESRVRVASNLEVEPLERKPLPYIVTARSRSEESESSASMLSR
jgi:hypothetical protein